MSAIPLDSAVNRFADFFDSSIVKRYFEHFPRTRSAVMSEDWDTLLILDACRYDAFEDLNTIPGNLESRLSSGSNTGEFFEKNFAGTTHHDTVYVTANPVPRVEKWCDVDIDSVFHHVVDVWEDHWDPSVNTVRPEPMAESVRQAHLEFPNKRIIGHFIQPHQPFIGETGRTIDEKGMLAYDELTDREASVGKKVWDQLEDGELPSDTVKQAYLENLEIVLPHVEAVVEAISGKTVVTADHGNLFGEYVRPFPIRRYGHPRGYHTENLIKVPWLEPPFRTRRTITTDPPLASTSETDRGSRLDRLAHLGYR